MSLTLLRVTQGKHCQARLPLFEPCHSKEVPFAFFTQTVIFKKLICLCNCAVPEINCTILLYDISIPFREYQQVPARISHLPKSENYLLSLSFHLYNEYEVLTGQGDECNGTARTHISS